MRSWVPDEGVDTGFGSLLSTYVQTYAGLKSERI